MLAAGVVTILVFGPRTTRRFERAFAVAIVAVALPLQLDQFTPAEWDLRTSLPLQLCDWAWVVAAIALWTRSRLAATITFLWGLTLTTQGVATPALETAFPGARWWMFWGMHLLIVWAAVHVAFGMKIRPTWRTYGQVVAITIGWLAATMTFNLAVGTNYGYLNGKPARASLLDLMGPWPAYVVVEVVVVAAVWAVLVAARVERKPRGKHRADTSPGWLDALRTRQRAGDVLP